MTNAALTWGCAFLAFAPSIALLFVIAFHKAQLIIVVTTSAFAYLLAAFSAALVWYILDLIGFGVYAVPILFPGVLLQFLWRCAFVKLYEKVENVIEISIARHEEREEEFHESAKLRLELNDWACGIAAGTGFGGMHAIMLYGTLLASEAGKDGTLYQEACPEIPSLALSAMNAFLFTFLDIVWMLFTFFGMRRIQMEVDAPLTLAWGALVGNSVQGGRIALAIAFVTHLGAALSTMPNQSYEGCRTSLSLVASILIITVLMFWGGLSKIYLPDNQRHRLGTSGGPSSHFD
jgi:hypothetical protein